MTPFASAAGSGGEASARTPERYGVVGHPIAHSKSPEIHARFAAQTGQRMRYERILAPLDGFVDCVESFAREGGRGLNVTVPFKLEAYALARERSARAELAGAANTLRRDGDHWYADNTDGVGLVRDLSGNLGFGVAGRRILVLGAGGATHGILGPLLAEVPAVLVVANRTAARAEALARTFRHLGRIEAREPPHLAGGRFDLVINATSSSLVGDGEHLIWPQGMFADSALAYDLSYGAGLTSFLRWASGHGAHQLADGLGMLVEQAAESFLVWRGVLPHTAPVLTDLRRLLQR